MKNPSAEMCQLNFIQNAIGGFRRAWAQDSTITVLSPRHHFSNFTRHNIKKGKCGSGVRCGAREGVRQIVFWE